MTPDTPPLAGSDAPTLMQLPNSDFPNEDASVDDANRRIQLVQGSCQGITGETHDLLRHRLRLAAWVLFAGFALFLTWHLTELVLGADLHLWPMINLAIVTSVLGVCAFALGRDREVCDRVLHVSELVIFGLPAIFFVQIQYAKMCQCAAEGAMIPAPAAPWILLIFTYALFIPNSWRRAAVILAAVALTPLLVTLVVRLTHELETSRTRELTDVMIEMALVMVTTYTAAVLGVKSIGNLRLEAHAGRALGQYHLRERIGSGGMGEVFLAEHQLMKRPCAIKLIRPEKAGDPQVLRRFEREVRATAQLSHWNNIDIYDYGHASCGTFYYVMEFLPGMNLDELVTRHGPLSADRVIYLLRQVCDALQEAHDVGIIHRDIKPANIFAAKRGGKHDVAKVLDFGLAKPMDSRKDIHLTQDGTVAGSPHYMSPEQVLGEESLDARTDIYSLGAVAYFLLTGRPPFDSTNPVRVMVAHTSEEPDPPSRYNSAIPEDLEHVVLRCLSKQPSDRYADAVQLSLAMDACDAADGWVEADADQWWLERESAASADEERDRGPLPAMLARRNVVPSVR